MRRMNWTKLLAAATAMTLMSAMPAMAAWQYTLQGPIAIWTETTTGQQVCVYAGQPAPDGTPAPSVTMTAQTSSTAQSIAAANAAVDAAKAARGGNVSQSGTLTAEQLAANTAAANENLQLGTVTTIDRTLPKRGSSSPSNSYTNASLPTIPTQDQSQLNAQNGLTANSYLSPAGVDQTKKTYSYNTNNGTYSFYASDGHLVTNASSPDVNTNTTTQQTTQTQQSAQTTQGTTNTANSSTPGVNYTGTLPSTGASNVNTYQTPQA